MEEVNCSNVIQQLQWSLQALALDAKTQISCFPDFVVFTDELMLDFDHWWTVSVGNCPEYFSEEQINIMKEILTYMDKYNDVIDESVSITEELQTHLYWVELRTLAQRALKLFDWPLNVPPLERTIYIKGR